MSVVDDLRELDLTEVVTTSNGPIQGYRANGLEIFKGVRYAAPPLGQLRFQPPQRPAPWTEVVETISLGAPSIQVGIAPGETTGGRSAGDPPATGQPGTDEDCLFINVWTPSLTGKRPVMVWLHGGGFANGSGGAAMYDGEALARRGDVVMVTVNHRLNVFGYLHLGDLGGHPSSGQAGMLDIVMVLEWVRDNIASFGGDPGCVTIFGESGGGMKVAALLAMPAAGGLFHRAIIQSGPWLKAVSRENATSTPAPSSISSGSSPANSASWSRCPPPRFRPRRSSPRRPTSSPASARAWTVSPCPATRSPPTRPPSPGTCR